MKFILNDGGRREAGFLGKAGDCGVRAAAIASGVPYIKVYRAIRELQSKERPRGARKSSPRTGIWPRTLNKFLVRHGFKWVATMGIGTGCKVHLHDGELPMGRLVVRVSKHYTAVIDGVIQDTHDPQRESHQIEPDKGQELKPGQWRNVNGICSIARRCVYGYWIKTA